MLSFIYRLVRDFEVEHDIHPNLLYLSQVHMHVLREQLNTTEQLDEIVQLLGMGDHHHPGSHPPACCLDAVGVAA